MKKLEVLPRPGWQKLINDEGLIYDVDPDFPDDHYWTEGECYLFSRGEVESIFEKSSELYGMCIHAALDLLSYPESQTGLTDTMKSFVKASYDKGEQDLYSRMDLSYNIEDGTIKLLEFNADTPLCVVETAVCQNSWQQYFVDISHPILPGLGSGLIDRWTNLIPLLDGNLVHVAFLDSFLDEEEANSTVIAYAAEAAGLEVKPIYVDQIFFDNKTNRWLDIDGVEIKNLFKMYPWIDLFADVDSGYDRHLIEHSDSINILNPAWTMLLSSKALLVSLWKNFSYHPYLLESYFSAPHGIKNWVKKPLNGSCGRDVVIHAPDYGIEEVGESIDGDLGCSVYQEFSQSLDDDRSHITLSVFFTGNTPVDICIRRSPSYIVDDNSGVFVPVAIED